MPDRTRIWADVTDSLKQMVQADPRNTSEVIKSALWKEFGGTRKSAVRMRINHKEQRIEVIEDEMRSLQQELNEERTELEQLQAMLDDAVDESPEAIYETICEEMTVNTRTNVLAYRKLVNDVIDHPETAPGWTEEHVHETLSYFAEKRGYQIDSDRFDPESGRSDTRGER